MLVEQFFLHIYHLLGHSHSQLKIMLKFVMQKLSLSLALSYYANKNGTNKREPKLNLLKTKIIALNQLALPLVQSKLHE